MPPVCLADFDFIAASPPCQHDSQLTPRAHRAKHQPLIDETRAMLAAAGVPFAIENVPSAAWRLRRPLMLCGSMFGLRVRRHRFFELGNWNPALLLPPCDHSVAPVLISGTHRRTYEPRYEYTAQQCRDASGLDWMTRKEIDLAIPPAYSEFIGRAFLAQQMSMKQSIGAVGVLRRVATPSYGALQEGRGK